MRIKALAAADAVDLRRLSKVVLLELQPMRSNR
jgi:hypothetical protein